MRQHSIGNSCIDKTFDHELRTCSPTPKLLTGGLLGSAQTLSEAEAEMRERQIERGSVSPVEGEVAAVDEEIGLTRPVADPVAALRWLGPERVSALEVRSGEVVAGSEDRLRILEGDPVRIAAGGEEEEENQD